MALTPPTDKNHEVVDIGRYFHPSQFPVPAVHRTFDSVHLGKMLDLVLHSDGWKIAHRWAGYRMKSTGETDIRAVSIHRIFPELFDDPIEHTPPDLFSAAVAILAYGLDTGQLIDSQYSITPVMRALSVPADLFDADDERRITTQRPVSETQLRTVRTFTAAVRSHRR